MSLPQHVYGTACHEEPHAWVLRLHDPFLLAWPEAPQRAAAVKLWPQPPFHRPDLYRHICGLMDFGSYRSLTYGFADRLLLPSYLYVEEPDGPWSGVLDLQTGLLFIPNHLSILVSAPDFPVPGGRPLAWAAPEEALAAAQRWHDDFITDPQFV